MAPRAPPGVPTVEIDRARLSAGIPAVDLLVETGLVELRNRGRQLIEGAGPTSTTSAWTARPVGEADLRDGALLLRQGKKRYLRVVPR